MKYVREGNIEKKWENALLGHSRTWTVDTNTKILCHCQTNNFGGSYNVEMFQRFAYVSADKTREEFKFPHEKYKKKL